MITNDKRPEWLSFDLYPFEGRLIQIDGNIIHYVDEGKGDIILFSHAAAGWSFMFRDMIRILSRSYRCIALDYPGFGLSKANPGYQFTVRAQAAVMTGFIEALHLQDIYVLGHDSGGPSAFSAMIPIPGNVKGFIICDALIFPVSRYKKIAVMLGIVSTPVFKFINGLFNIVVSSMLKVGFKNRKLSEEENNGYRKMFADKNSRKHVTDVLASLKKDEELMRKLQLAFENTFNKKPALLIYGEKDPLIQLGIPAAIAALLKNSVLKIVRGEAHFPIEGEYEQISLIVGEWIKAQKISKNTTALSI
jgi:haloalkane dehalogenase